MSKKYNIEERAQKQWENYSIFSIVHALVEKNKDNGLFNISLKYYPQPLYPDIADVYDENNPAYKSLKNLKNINMINPSLEKIKGQDLRAIRAAQGICFRALARFPQFSQMSNIMLYDINNNKNLAMSEFLERLSNITDKNERVKFIMSLAIDGIQGADSETVHKFLNILATALRPSKDKNGYCSGLGLAMVFKEDDKPLIRGLVGQEGLFDEIKPWEDIVNRDVSNFCNQLNARSNSKEIEI